MEKRPFGIDRDYSTEKHARQQFDVLKPREFLEDFKLETGNAIKTSGFDGWEHKSWLQAMSINFYGRSTKELFDIVREANARGFDTRLHIDSFHDWTGRIKDRLHKRSSGSLKEAFPIVRNRHLSAEGVIIERLNPMKNPLEKFFYYRGRNHIKIARIDDKFWIGGINFSEDEFNGRMEDFTVKITDPKITEAIEKQFMQVNENRPQKDYEVKCTEDTTLLIDSGKPRESIILKKAIEAVNGARKRILIASQCMPEGKLLKAIHDAYKRGLEVVCLQNDPKKEDLQATIMNTLSRIKATPYPIPVTVIPDKIVHSKLLIADDTAFFGSHNFSQTGVDAGTEEMDIQTKEPVLVNNLTGYFQKLQISGKMN